MEEVSALVEKVDKLYEDIYLGRGKDNPPMITRLDRLEQALANMTQIKWLILGIFVTLLGDMFASALHLRF